MNEVRKPYPDTSCVGCGRHATRYCEGWDLTTGGETPHGQFETRVQCSYPVCNSCSHEDHELRPAMTDVIRRCKVAGATCGGSAGTSTSR